VPAPGNTNDVSSLIETALLKRTELLSLRDEHEAELRFARSQRDARLPTISATGAAGNSPIHDDRLPDNYAAGSIQLSLPLFAGGLYSARQHEAELRARAAAELLRTVEDNIVRNARERLRISEHLVGHASEAYDLAQARYKAGSSSIELSQAQLELTSAQIANTNARCDVLIRQANLNYQTGGLARISQPTTGIEK